MRLGSFIFVCSISFSTASIGQDISKGFDTVDSILMNHFLVLESYLKDVNSDPSMRRIEAIHFLEIISGIKSNSDGNYFGKMSCSKDELEAWHKWYSRNITDSMTCLCQQTFENQFVRLCLTTTAKEDSIHFRLNLTNKSSEYIFVPVQNALHSRIWANSPMDLIELELGYDLEMVTEGDPDFARIEPGQTVDYMNGVAIKDEKHYVTKLKVNLFMSRHKTFIKKRARLEWFTLDFRLP